MITVFLIVVGTAGFSIGWLCRRLAETPCIHCVIAGEEQRALHDIHAIEQQTITQLTSAARAALQSDVAKHTAPRFYGEE